MKFVKTDYGNNIEILKYGVQDYISRPIMVSATGIVANEDGKKIVKAGSILNNAGVIVNDGSAEGVLLWDVDVTYGDAPGSLVMFGFIDGTKLPNKEISSNAMAAMKLIKFVDIPNGPNPVITLTAGEMDAQHKVKVAVKVEDASDVTAKYLYDAAAKQVSDFASAGTAITLTDGKGEVEVTADDSADKYLTVYAKDSEGNESVQNIKIVQY